MGRAIKGILFDKDGTLYDFHATWAGWTENLIQSLADNDMTAAELADILGFDRRRMAFSGDSIIIAGTPAEIIERILENIPRWDADELLETVRVSASRTKLVEAAPLAPLLDRLTGMGQVLGVATNDLQSVAEAHLAASGVADRFAFVAGCDSGYGAKPGSGMQAAFCRATGLAPAQVAMIGDSVHDLVSGKDAGMLCIGVLSGPAHRDILAPYADVVLENIGQLPDWIAQENDAPNAT